MARKTQKNGMGCGTFLLFAFLLCIAIVIYSYAWIPAIGAIIFFYIKKDRADRKRNLIISSAVAATSLFLFIGTNSTTDLSGIEVDWGKTEFSVSDKIEIKVTPVPSDAKIDSLEMSENPIATLKYKDGKAIISFKSEGEASIFFTANGNIQSDMQEIKVVNKYSDAEEPKEPEVTEEITNCNTKIHFLDVGQGLSVLVQSDGKNLIYDGGDGSHSSFVVAYLKEQNIETIDYLVSSHYDEDHLSGLLGCLNAFSVSNVIGPNYVHDSQLYQSFMNMVSDKGLEVQHPNVGDTFNLGSSSFTILSPRDINQSESNDNSVAIKITCGDNSFILTGDAESGSESDMIASGIDLSCNVLCLGHHGSATATSWDFLQRTVPEYAVISCGADNQYGHPDKDTLDKLSSMEISLFRTDKQGTIIVESDGKSITWSTEPCNDYSPGALNDIGTPVQQQSEEPQVQQPQAQTYVLNTSTMKFHSPHCRDVKKISAANYSTYEGSREDLINQNYSPCGHCNP